MDREVQVFRTFQLGDLDDRPIYSPLMSAYPPIPQSFTWRGEVTALQLTNNLKTLNSFTISLEDNEGSYYPLIQGIKVLPSESNIDLLAALFGGRKFTFAMGTSLVISIDFPERIKEGDFITISGSATESTLEDVVIGTDSVTQAELQAALQPYIASAEVATVLNQHEGENDPHSAYTPTTALAALINGYIQAGDIAIPEPETEIKAKASFGYRSGQIVIDKSENIASINRTAVGRYQVTFTNPINHPYVVIGHSMFGDSSTNSHRVFDAVFRTSNGFLAMSSHEPAGFEDAQIMDFIVT